MIAKLKAAWGALPHLVQAGVVTMASATGVSIVQALSNPTTACFTWPCIKHLLAGAIVAGAAALRAFYMIPNIGAKAIAPNSGE